MPWDETYNPAIDAEAAACSAIANARLEEGYDEGKAIRIAIAKATEWADSREWS